MCGFVGILDGGQTVEEGLLRAMAQTLDHRGPDDEGYWTGHQGRIGFGFKRLSILDLSPLGHQPMASPTGRFTMVFNGEIYNFKELRARLEERGRGFRGGADTEVMLTAFEDWGIRATLELANGMFAMAIWDAELEELTLARDRFGKKPLYYARCGQGWVFGSELKALQRHPDFKDRVSTPALAAYFRYGYVPGPQSIFEQCYKLPPGHCLRLKSGSVDTVATAYWAAEQLIEAPIREPYTGTRAQAMVELDELLKDAVGLRMVADVPLGAFLSGGIDSSLVVALMQAQSDKPVRTFTIGFHEDGFDEARYAKAVAHHLGTDHTEWYLGPQEAMDTIPDMGRIYDEPFADASQIPTYLVSRLARQHVTVALSGDGGDELFGGYNRYFLAEDVRRKIGWLPRRARLALRGLLLGLPPVFWENLFRVWGRMLPAPFRAMANRDHLLRAAALLETDTLETLYRALTSLWPNPELLLPGVREAASRMDETFPALAGVPSVARMMFLDTVTYLVDDILVKVDRANMACSLEGRAPLLDWRVANFAWRLPLEWKVQPHEGKILLKQLAYSYVPRELLDRPKMGFGVPIGAWLRRPLRGWAEDLLAPARLAEEGLAPEAIHKVWNEHLAGKRDWQYQLWPILMYMQWRGK